MVGLITVGAGIWQFSIQSTQANKRPFLQKQLAFCLEATDTAARLATETDPTEWARLNQRFWQLYWGRLAVVEDRILEGRMVDFGNQIPKLPVPAATLPVECLRVPALMIALASRSLVAQSWKVELGPLKLKLGAARPEENLKEKDPG